MAGQNHSYPLISFPLPPHQPCHAFFACSLPTLFPIWQCHGTKDLRRRPAMLLARGSRPALLDAAKTHYECFHCGPLTKYDIDPYAPVSRY